MYIKKTEEALHALHEQLRTGERTNRRKVLTAYKLVLKAAKTLGIAPPEKQPRPASNSRTVNYPLAPDSPVIESDEGGPVLADNTPIKTGPERPAKSRAKTKA